MVSSAEQNLFTLILPNLFFSLILFAGRDLFFYAFILIFISSFIYSMIYLYLLHIYPVPSLLLGSRNVHESSTIVPTLKEHTVWLRRRIAL